MKIKNLIKKFIDAILSAPIAMTVHKPQRLEPKGIKITNPEIWVDGVKCDVVPNSVRFQHSDDLENFEDVPAGQQPTKRYITPVV